MTGSFDAEKNEWTPYEGGWKWSNIHPESDECRTDGCVAHNPTLDHVSNRENWPYFPRGDGRMERLCPHGVGHPDPDVARWLQKHHPGYAPYVHGCHDADDGSGRSCCAV